MSLAENTLLASPNPPLARSPLRLVGSKLTLLYMLKNSARNSACAPSFPTNQGMRVFLAAEKSVLTYPGPTKLFRPTLPRAPGAGAGKRLPHREAVQLKIPARN